MLHFSDEFETQNIKVVRLCMNSFGVNTYLLICKKTRETAVIDPGGETQEIVKALQKEKAKAKYIIFTHMHIDHMYGAVELKQALPDAVVGYHSNDQLVVDNIPDMCRMFGWPVCETPEREMDLKETPEFSVGEIQLRSFLTPGHTPGGVCYYIPEEKICFTGDTLFKGSVGRTDFEGGSGAELRKSLNFLLKVLPSDVQILPGHGKYSTMGVERETNMFMKIDRYRD